jgi:hypothetical protein
MEDQKEHHWQKRQQVADECAPTEAMSLESVRETMHEEQGYDAPFATFTWRHWMDLQARTVQCFSRFVRAVEERHPDHAIMIGLEIQEVATSLLLEAYAQSASIPLEELPAERLRRFAL